MQSLQAKIESAARTQQMGETVKMTTPALQRAIKSMDSAGINDNMANFQKVFEDMDIKTQEMDGVMEDMY